MFLSLPFVPKKHRDSAGATFKGGLVYLQESSGALPMHASDVNIMRSNALHELK